MKTRTWSMLLACVILPAFLSADRAGAAMIKWAKNTPQGKKINKAALQAALRTVGKTTLKRVSAITTVWDCTYTATRAVVNSPSYYDAGVAIIEGIQNDKAWAIAGAEVECFGLEMESNVGQNTATANRSQACSFHGSSAASTVQVSRGLAGGENCVNVEGHANAPDAWLTSPSAHWIGLGGVGDKLVIKSDVLDIVEKIKDTIIDPTLLPHSSWLDAQASPESGAAQLTALYDPAGFSILTRVYMPQTGSEPYLYYESEVSAWLGIRDIQADYANDFFGIETFIQSDYFNPDGSVIRTLSGADVCSLDSSDFNYFDGTASPAGQTINTFGFSLQNFDLGLRVDLPANRDISLPLLIDMEVLAGSRAAGGIVPEPGSALLLTIGVAWLLSRWPRSGRNL